MKRLHLFHAIVAFITIPQSRGQYEEYVHEHKILTTQSSAPTTQPVIFPTQGSQHTFMTYVDFMLASIANSTWPSDISFQTCSKSEQCSPDENCFVSLGCTRGLCIDVASPQFQRAIEETSFSKPFHRTNHHMFIKPRLYSVLKPKRRKHYYWRRKNKLTYSNWAHPSALYGRKCSSFIDCQMIGNGGVPCIRNGTNADDNYCLCPHYSFFYRQSYCKNFEYGDDCTEDYQCNQEYLLQDRLVCRAGLCRCADEFAPVTVLSLRAFWGVTWHPSWLITSGPGLRLATERTTYCLRKVLGSYFTDIPAGTNCTVDIIGSPSPKICAKGLTCLYCAGDTKEGTCIKLPILSQTITTIIPALSSQQTRFHKATLVQTISLIILSILHVIGIR